MYRYETHLHTAPVSRCARADVSDSLSCYNALGYDGVFVTNHFLDGNVNIERERPYAEKLAFYVSDYEQALRLAPTVGIKVFFGVELSYGGTDFLIYGLPPDWYFAHPEIMEMEKSAELPFLMEQGALVIQAHPFREAGYIDHIRLYPRCVHGVEVINACRTELANEMAQLYAERYDLLPFAGTDNHVGSACKKFAGLEFDTPVSSEADFIARVRRGEQRVFTLETEDAPSV